MKKFPQQHQGGDQIVSRAPKQKQKTVWIAGATVAVGVVGAGVSAYGANTQANAAKDAAKDNQRNFNTQQTQNWNQYLLQRGVNAGNNDRVGSFGAGTPVNTKLPMWANVTTGQRKLVPLGTAPVTPKLVTGVPATVGNPA